MYLKTEQNTLPGAGSHVSANFASTKNKPNNCNNYSGNNNFESFASGDLT